jgi:shikimate kinase
MVIVLVGPKHSGKTSAGRALAQLFRGVFYDVDEEITQAAGKSPRALFEEGKAVFQAAEAEAAASLIQRIRLPDSKTSASGGPSALSFHVIAAGGGIIDNPPAWAALKTADALVYLRVSAASAWARIMQSASKEGSLPPFLRTDDPETTHRALHEVRGGAYEAGVSLVVDCGTKSPEGIAREIAKLLSFPVLKTLDPPMESIILG